MSGEELYNESVAKYPTFATGERRRTWENLGEPFRRAWEKKAAELTTPPCKVCGQWGHADMPCPGRDAVVVEGGGR